VKQRQETAEAVFTKTVGGFNDGSQDMTILHDPTAYHRRNWRPPQIVVLMRGQAENRGIVPVLSGFLVGAKAASAQQTYRAFAFTARLPKAVFTHAGAARPVIYGNLSKFVTHPFDESRDEAMHPIKGTSASRHPRRIALRVQPGVTHPIAGENGFEQNLQIGW